MNQEHTQMKRVPQIVIHVLRVITAYPYNRTMHLLMRSHAQKVITVLKVQDWIGEHVQ